MIYSIVSLSDLPEYLESAHLSSILRLKNTYVRIKQHSTAFHYKVVETIKPDEATIELHRLKDYDYDQLSVELALSLLSDGVR